MNQELSQKFIERLVPLFQNIEDLNQDVKAILDEAKEQGIENATDLSKIAKAIVKDNLEELEDKTKDLLTLIEQSN
jgi:uncharacterized protein (UPF0335 family)